MFNLAARREMPTPGIAGGESVKTWRNKNACPPQERAFRIVSSCISLGSARPRE